VAQHGILEMRDDGREQGDGGSHDRVCHSRFKCWFTHDSRIGDEANTTKHISFAILDEFVSLFTCAQAIVRP
jgi:hypothetical protein